MVRPLRLENIGHCENVENTETSLGHCPFPLILNYSEFEIEECPTKNIDVYLLRGQYLSRSDYVALRNLELSPLQYEFPLSTFLEKSDTLQIEANGPASCSKIEARYRLEGEWMTTQPMSRIPKVLISRSFSDALPFNRTISAGGIALVQPPTHDIAYADVISFYCDGTLENIIASVIPSYEIVRDSAFLRSVWSDKGRIDGRAAIAQEILSTMNTPPNGAEGCPMHGARQAALDYFKVNSESLPFPQNESAESRSPNVLIIMFDAVSRGSFSRTMPRTMKYLSDLHRMSKVDPLQPKLLEFENYALFGRSSIPNQVPFFMGKSTLACYPGYQSCERCEKDKNCQIFIPETEFVPKNSKQSPGDLVFNLYEVMGYVTGFSEQCSQTSGVLPNTIRTLVEPKSNRCELSDHVMDEVFALDDYYAGFEGQRCVAGKRAFEHTASYLMSFMEAYQHSKTPFFLATHTFDGHETTGVGMASTDKDFEVFLRTAASFGLLDNTLVIITSDHGLGYGPQMTEPWALYELMNPLLLALVPPTIAKHGKLLENMRKNQKRLVTHLDVYDTLRLIPFLQDQGNIFSNANPRDRTSFSLFEEIPEGRRCSDALVPFHVCPCGAADATNSENEPFTTEQYEEYHNLASKALNIHINGVIDEKGVSGCSKLQVCRVISGSKMELMVEIGSAPKEIFRMVFDTQAEVLGKMVGHRFACMIVRSGDEVQVAEMRRVSIMREDELNCPDAFQKLQKGSCVCSQYLPKEENIMNCTNS